ncbi:hypothetical protein [uncultured Flavobacterium sp.]|mgnify:CR=1 FL=1|uniref:hypothetical protein n=1 Tax=uncultured Flavobacterium sp. TaxID=165435 RepID=UPI00261E1F45|nr:hypothetical protein [uncultured Flavobacterium sp.]
MKTTKTVRSYKYLIITILNFIVLFIAKIYYEYLDNLDNPFVFSGDERESNFYREINSKQDILANILMISVILSLIIIIKKIKDFKLGIEKLILGIWFIYLITMMVEFLNFQTGDIAYRICKTYFFNYLLFIPHLFIIYRKTFIGEIIDLSNEIINKEEKKFSNSLEDLKKLLELGQISEQEFNSKRETILKKKIETEIKLTEEYKLLEKTKNTGLINEDEFKFKFFNLIEKKYHESL